MATFQGSNVVAAPRDRVWAMLQDPKVLERLIPGLSDIIEDGSGQYRATLNVNRGPIKQKFKATVRLGDLQAPESMTLHIEAKNMTGGANIQAKLSLVDLGNSTRVDWQAEPRLSGLLASVGGKVLESKASDTGAGQGYANRFFDLLSKQA